MSRRGFWFGVLVGAVVMGLLAATAGFVLVRSRWPGAALPALRGRGYGITPWGSYPRMPGRWLGSAAVLCGPVLLLILGALVLAALLGRHWHHHHGDDEASCRGKEPPALDKSVKVESEAPVAAASSEAAHAEQEPPAEAGSTEPKS